ncbi:hypothetical protein ebA2309 [Aromatoleum aromaticum EbN1]|uniref:Uncharacterized protein n=1 Tax=Aromatoleum aromaticum (strain DSM 19018 / LMG 30748 / EbN1) TaxID=76114 RepID=Q5P5L1_AROAE|nr:hypothetical protein ebA2309 [Aromatoleum aromaticum EbN1]
MDVGLRPVLPFVVRASVRQAPRVEPLFRSARRSARGAAVAAGAYVTDYYLVPKRFTPGYEKRLSGQSLALIYGALALGLAAGALLGKSGRE